MKSIRTTHTTSQRIKRNILSVAILSAISMHSGYTLANGVDNLVTTENNKFIYQPGFFSKYAPQNATDMVLQIPGFKLIGANRNGGNGQAVRGLGQGNGNLLLNGKRVSSKDNSPLDLLARIPAENISYIEILTKGSTELAGQSGQIVNVVYLEPEKVNGSWVVNVHTQEHGITQGSIEASIAGKLNNIGYTASVNRYNNEFPQWGKEKKFDEENKLTEIRDEYADFYNNGLDLSLGLSWEGANSQSANLNISTSHDKSTFFEDSNRYLPASDPQSNEFGNLVSEVDFRSNQDRTSYEIGGDYSRDLAGGVWKIIGLRRNKDIDESVLFKDQPTEGNPYTYKAVAQPIETESVLRTLFTYQPQEGHSIDIALEGVKNSLKTATVYEENNGAGFVEFEEPGSNIEVKEDRAEFSVQYSRPLTDDWSLQSLIATEYSKLSVVGDIEPRSDSFQRYKGFLALSGALSGQSSLRGRIERSIGQLRFSDFATSKNINEGYSNGGNTHLVPEQTWRAELSYEHTFGATDQLTITGFVERVDDFITFVPFENGKEGRGNIDKLNTKGIDISGTITLDRFGIEGAKLDLLAEFHESTLIDPVTGKEIEYREHRHNPVHYKATFRHDIPDTSIAWGIIVEERSGNVRNRLNETSSSTHRWPQAHKFFFEHKDLAGMTFKVETEDIFGFTWKNTRTYYDGDRNGEITGRELNSRHSPWFVRMSLTGNF